MIKTDKTRERAPKRFLDKKPDRTRPSTPEPELQTDPTNPAAPQIGATPQLISEEYTLPEGYVHKPGNYQAQRTWRDAETQPEAFDVAIQECHADCLRSGRGVDGIPAAMEFIGYDWQLVRDGNGVLYNTIYANYAPAGGGDAVDAPLLDEANKGWHPQDKGGSKASGAADNDKQDDERKRKEEDERKRREEEQERQRQQGQHPNQPGQNPNQPGTQPYMPPGQNPQQQPFNPGQPGHNPGQPHI